MALKKIFFILPNLDQGGAERIITIILNGIDLNVYKPTLFLFEKKGYYLSLLRPDIVVKTINTNRIRFSIFKFIPLIYQEKPDIVFSGWGEISAFLSPFIKFFPKTHFITRETNVVSQHVTRKEILFFYRFYKNFKTIIAQSEDMRDDLITNFNIDPTCITLINNPVDFQLIESKISIGKPQEFSQHNKNIIAVGNLTYRKGFDNLLHVFSYLKNENISLYILGDGADREKLLQLKESLELEKVHFLGRKENPFQYVHNADLFVLSSRYEGFPNVLLEAGACGTYALANNCKGGIREIIQHNINGEISNIENHENFAKKIKQVLHTAHDAEAIKNSIKSRYAKEFILEKYFSLFQTVISD